MKAPLIFKAGATARKVIEQDGLHPHQLAAIAGAAGGPKWLVLAGLDRLLFGQWLQGRSAPLPLVGASIGSWRFAAVAQADPLAAIDRLEHGYIHQCYDGQPSPRQVTTTARDIIIDLLGDRGGSEILSHPWARLHIITARALGWTAYDSPLRMSAGFAAAIALNTLHRPLLSRFLQRRVFGDPRPGKLPSFAFPGFNTELPALTQQNLADALLASGSIPFVMESVNIHGQGGRYRDGGMVDYHIDLPLQGDRDNGLVLMPHFSDQVIPGWLDKYVPWRRAENLDNYLIMHPSAEWVASLPNGKIPDRTDFKRYQGNDAARIRDWQSVARRSEELAEFLAERLEKGDLSHYL